MKLLCTAPPRELWTLKTKCLGNVQGPDVGCGATLLLEEEDLYVDKHWSTVEFKCCRCGTHTTVSPRRVPHRVARMLPVRARHYG